MQVTAQGNDLKFYTAAVERLHFESSGNTIFNESGVDADFRVESDANSHMLFVDAGNNRVIFGGSAQDAAGTMTYTSGTGLLRHTTAAGTAKDHLLYSISGVNNGFQTTQDTSNNITYKFHTGGNQLATTFGTTENVFNDASSDRDFRVESDTNSHAFFVNAGSNLINIGKSNSAATAAGVTFAGTSLAAQTNTIADGNTYHLHDTQNYKFYVNANGGIYNYQSNNVNLSDEREKKNIEELGSQWDVLKQWSLKKFHYNADDDLENKKYGVIAQDVQAHSPELVTDFMSTETETRLAVKEQQMMWMAIKALQEAQTRIETLETRLTALENA